MLSARVLLADHDSSRAEPLRGDFRTPGIDCQEKPMWRRGMTPLGHPDLAVGYCASTRRTTLSNSVSELRVNRQRPKPVWSMKTA